MAEEAIFSFVLESLRDLMINEAQLLHGVEDQVEKLEEQLNQMRWFLRDTASTNQERVLDWVIRVRNIAYEAEYLIESYGIKVAQGVKRGTIKRIARGLNKIDSGFETTIHKISELTNNFKDYGISQIMENNEASMRPDLRRTYSMVNDEDEVFFGSNDSINMLAEKLVSDQYRTITLYGMGGLGKTTLARKVYHHPVVIKHFDSFAWVCISQKWIRDDIWRGILIKLMPDQRRDDIEKWREEELVRELSKILSTSKCLLVLDDIWSISAWNSIKCAMNIHKNGSKVLLTTRNVEVCTLVDASGYKHEPKFLSDDESWELLCNKALRGQDSKETTKKERFRKEMISQCGGLPLAVVALGGILSSKSSDDQWKSVCDNVKSYLRNVTRDEKNVKAILALSYDDLPIQLKPCFLYLSKYAEDAEIEVETLYQYWMAEGMISSQDRMGTDETMMDVAEHYLNELAERCMVFVQKEEEGPLSRNKSCRLHGLMRDLCISKAKEEKFLQSIDYGNIHEVDEGREASTICRLSITFLEENDAKSYVPPAKAVRRSLRSFTLDGHEGNTLKLNFSEFVMLRVLSLDGVGIKDDEGSPGVCSVVYHKELDPLSIGKLVHLRYLSLRNTAFCIMSSSISNLKLLQTLDLRGCVLFWRISDVWNFPRLNHLYLPINIKLGDLAKKVGFEGMPQLEILEGFNTMVCNVKHLWTLTNLRKLKARVEDELEDLDELVNHVRKLTRLRFLELKIDIRDLSSEKAVAIINDIPSYSNLVILCIKGKLSKFPEHDDSIFCRNLQSLTLDRCEIKEDPVRTLERLPNLRILTLRVYSFVGKEMNFHASGFEKLRSLTLWELYKLEKWEIEAGAMPNLSELTIGRCYKLEMIPAGLRSNALLKHLDICKMPEEFKKRVVVSEDGEEGPDFHKVRHVQTINIERGHPCRYKFTRDVEVDKLKEMVFAMSQEMRDMGSQMDERMGARDTESPSTQVPPAFHSEEGSCSTFDPALIPEDESFCDVYVDSPAYSMVGSGSVYREEGQRMHNESLKAGQVRVCFREIVHGCEDTRLPYPNIEGEVYTVRDALGTYVARPIRLVSLQRQASRLGKSIDHSSTSIRTRKKPAYPQAGDVDNYVGFLLCKSYAKYNKSGDDVYDVAMPEPFFEFGYTEHIGVENLKEILNTGWLGASTICFYIRYLIDLYLVDDGDNQQRSRFVFISPHLDADHTHVADILLKHQSQDDLVLIPYNISAHWVLVVINTKTECIYYLDPLRQHHSHLGRAVLVEKINSAMITYRSLKQGASSTKRLSHNQWISVECPRQDSTSGYCGFYVCLFIQDILESNITTLSLAYPHQHRCDTFPINRITEVQQSWCSYLYNRYMEKE